MKITLAGVVGVGKSTVSKLLQEQYNFEVMAEPTTENPYLDSYYQDPKSMAFKMQMYMVMARSKQLKEAQFIKDVVFDRSILEDQIFVNVLHHLKYMDDIDYKVYMDFYNIVVLGSLYLNEEIKPDLVIYLTANVDNAIHRIIKRGRKSEQKVDREYWELLNKYYQKWYEETKNKFDFLVIDTNDITPQMIVEKIAKKLSLPEKKK